MLNNKKRLGLNLICLGILVASPISLAELASSKLKSVVLADGSKVNVRQWGDEFSHGWETEDGYTIIKDNASGAWYYADLDLNGSLIKSPQRVMKDQSSSFASTLINLPSKKYLRPSGAALDKAQLRRKNAHSKNAFASKRANLDSSKAESSTSGVVVANAVVQGQINVPVVLINFSDTTTQTTSSEFDQFLFNDAKGLSAYYQEVSYGKVDIQGGASGVSNWVKLPQSHDYYGQNNSSGYDANIGVMIGSALALIDDEIDFAQYTDVNQDCTVDLISFVYQGNGEHQAAGQSDDIWAHKYSLYWLETEGDGNGEYQTNDLCPSDPSQYMKINDYFVAPELSEAGTRAHVGTFAHEFGHVFGLPDLYDTNGATDGQNAGAGDWSLMASGSKVGPERDGESPAHISAWGKYTLGWLTPTKVNNVNDIGVQLRESAFNAEAILYENTANPSEYFIIENRNQRGFDAYTPGTGLAIWHIDDAIAAPGADGSTQSDVNAIACDFGFQDCSNNHNGVALVAADYYYDLEHDFNDGDQHDLFGQDGDGGASEYGSEQDEDSEFSADGQITSNWWDNSASGLAVLNISSKGDTMSFDLGAGTTQPTDEIVLVNNSNEIINGAVNEQVRAYIDVPQDASNLVVAISHNSGGDADLYLNYGSYDSSNNADCFLNTGNNVEVCDESVFGNTQAGRYYAVITGYNGSAFSNVSLSASYDISSGGASSVTTFNVDVANGEYQHFQVDVPQGANRIAAVLDKNGGAAMLMLNEGAQASARTYDERDTSGNNVTVDNPAANTWYIAVRGRNGGINNGVLTVTVN